MFVFVVFAISICPNESYWNEDIYLIGGCLIFVAAFIINKRRKRNRMEKFFSSIYWWVFEQFILVFSMCCRMCIQWNWCQVVIIIVLCFYFIWFLNIISTLLPLCCCWPAFENGGSLYWSDSLPIGYAEYWFAVGSDSYVDANATSTPCWKRWYANQAQPPYIIPITDSIAFAKYIKWNIMVN